MITAVPKLLFVNVVGCVAAAAGGRHVATVSCRLPVAIGARERHVRSVQDKRRMKIVIKCGNRPVIWQMTGATVLSERAGVRIIVAMAGHAVRGRIVKAVALVT